MTELRQRYEMNPFGKSYDYTDVKCLILRVNQIGKKKKKGKK